MGTMGKRRNELGLVTPAIVPGHDNGEFFSRKVQRVVALTATFRVEGLLHSVHDMRLSDFMNAENKQDVRYLPLSDVTVSHLESGTTILKTSFMLVTQSRITGVIPTESIREDALAETEAEAATA